MCAQPVQDLCTPFALWIQDLSSRDPFFILPALMAITTLAQQKLSALRDEVDALSRKYAPSSVAPFATQTNATIHVGSHGGLAPRQFPWSMS